VPLRLLTLIRPHAQVVKVRPNDRDAKMKYSECSKIVKKKAFEKAIAYDDEKKSMAESINVDTICKISFYY